MQRLRRERCREPIDSLWNIGKKWRGKKVCPSFLIRAIICCAQQTLQWSLGLCAIRPAVCLTFMSERVCRSSTRQWWGSWKQYDGQAECYVYTYSIKYYVAISCSLHCFTLELCTSCRCTVLNTALVLVVEFYWLALLEHTCNHALYIVLHL